MASQLPYLTKWKCIYVTPDLSRKEREENKRLREELSARRRAGEEHLMIRRGKIVKVNEETMPKPDPHPKKPAPPSVPTTVHTEQRTTQSQAPAITLTGQDFEHPPVRQNTQPQAHVMQGEEPQEGMARQD